MSDTSNAGDKVQPSSLHEIENAFMSWLYQKFELSRGGDAHNVKSMEGLRGLAVFLVFLVHYVTLVNPWISQEPTAALIARTIHTIGNTGVDLFFVLSGYLIYGSLLSNNPSFLKFIFRRIKRIYPTFCAVFAIYVFLSIIFPTESKIPANTVAAAIYLIQNLLLLPGLFQIEPLITVAWSLSYEMFYYLVIPFVMEIFRLKNRSSSWRITFFLSLILLDAVYCAIYGGPIRLIMFIFGIILYEFMCRKFTFGFQELFGPLTLIFGLYSTLLPINGTGGSAIKTVILGISFYLLCFACFQNHATWFARKISWTPLRWLGNMSYSYYLLHGLTLKAIGLIIMKIISIRNFENIFFWTAMPLIFAITVIPSMLLFLLVERPFSLRPLNSYKVETGCKKVIFSVQ